MKLIRPLLALSALVLSASLFAQSSDTQTAAKLKAVGGSVSVKMPDGSVVPATPGMTLPQGAEIITGAQSQAQVEVHEGIVAVLGSNTTAGLEKLSVNAAGVRSGTVDLKSGTLASSLDPKRKAVNNYAVKTPKGVAAARGTTYSVTFNGVTFSVNTVSGVVSAGGRDIAAGTTYDAATGTVGTLSAAATSEGFSMLAAAVAAASSDISAVTAVVSTLAAAAGGSEQGVAIVAAATSAAATNAAANTTLSAAPGGTTSIAQSIVTAAVQANPASATAVVVNTAAAVAAVTNTTSADAGAAANTLAATLVSTANAALPPAATQVSAATVTSIITTTTITPVSATTTTTVQAVVPTPTPPTTPAPPPPPPAPVQVIPPPPPVPASPTGGPGELAP